MIVVGIDPDLNGGIAVLNVVTCEVIALHRMPLHEHPVTGAKTIKVEEVHTALTEARTRGATDLILEGASIRPGQGNSGRIMTHYGMLLGIAHLVFTRPAVLIAQPSKWKPAMKLSGDKSKSLELAKVYHPGHGSVLSKQKNAGIAEAMLLCHWAKKNELKCTSG